MFKSRATMRGIPGDSARKRGLLRVLVPVLVFGLAFGFAFGILLGNVGLAPWWLGLTILFITFGAFFLFRRYQPSLVYGYFKGARGEEMVAGELARLPATWTIFNGLILPNGQDVDHIAVGPQGVFVIETKHWTGEVSIEEGRLLAKGRQLNKSPVVQVRALTAAIAEHLPQFADHVHGVLCFAGTQFFDAPQQLDEIQICSYLNLSELLMRGTAPLNVTEVSSCVASLGDFAITQGL